MKALNTQLEGMGIATSNTVEHPQVQAIRERLFEVEALPLTPPAEGYDAPELIGLYKTTGGQNLGVAKDSYGIMQPETFFDSIANALNGIGYDFNKNEIEYISTKNDRVISFKVPLDVIDFKNKAGVGDITEVYALFTTSFDGSLSTRLAIYSKRLLCANGVLFKTQKDTAFNFRHTPNMNARALTYTDAIIKSSKNIQKYGDLFKQLDRIEVTPAQVDRILSDITGYDLKEYKNLHRKKQEIIDGIRNAWAIEKKDCGTTAFGVFNAVTRFTNYDAQGNLRNEDYVMFGTGTKLNHKAEKVMVDLARV